MLVDESESGEEIRVLCYLEHSIQDARSDAAGRRRVVSRRMQFVDLDAAGHVRSAGDAPYLDLRPIADDERPLVQSAVESQGWLREKLEDRALLLRRPGDWRRRTSGRCKSRKEAWVDKTVAAVKDRLTKEITYWDTRAAHLSEQERAGRVFAKVNSQKSDAATGRFCRRASRSDSPSWSKNAAWRPWLPSWSAARSSYRWVCWRS